jgi:hypothetical protein
MELRSILRNVGEVERLTQPKTWIIAQTDPNSRHYAASQQNLASTLASARAWAWSVDVWPAVDGWTMSSGAWDSIGVSLLPRGAILKRPGAQGCFHSHFGLWLWCVEHQRSAVILEHDAKITGPWPSNINLEQNIWKLHQPDGRGDRVNDYTGLWSCGAWAYTVTAAQAARLVEFSRRVGAQAVDKQIGSLVVPWTYYPSDLVTHAPRAKSTTSPKDPRLLDK